MVIAMMVITVVVTTAMAIPVMRMMMDITTTAINTLDRLPGDQPWDVVPGMFTVRQPVCGKYPTASGRYAGRRVRRMQLQASRRRLTPSHATVVRLGRQRPFSAPCAG